MFKNLHSSLINCSKFEENILCRSSYSKEYAQVFWWGVVGVGWVVGSILIIPFWKVSPLQNSHVKNILLIPFQKVQIKMFILKIPFWKFRLGKSVLKILFWKFPLLQIYHLFHFEKFILLILFWKFHFERSILPIPFCNFPILF